MATDTNITIGKLGSLGLAIEVSAGTANATAAVYIPYANGPTLRGHHTPLEDISINTSRIMDKSSVLGKRWSEGDAEIWADTVNSGYFWKLALGNELLVTGTPNNHTFITTVSGNTPLTATLIHSRGTTDIEQYTFCAIESLNFEVAEGLAKLTAAFKGQYPSNGASQTVTTTSGTVLAFKDYFVQFGATLTAAGTSATSPLTDFKLTIANNLEVIHRSGSSDVSTIRTKGVKVTGSYTLFFDSITDRDAYYALQKRSLILTASGINNESLRIRIPQFRLNEADVKTGLDTFYVVTANFVAEDVIDTGTRFIEVRLQNNKSVVY